MALALLATSCGSAQAYSRHIKTFQESYDEASPALAELYTGLNRWNRRGQWMVSVCSEPPETPVESDRPPPGFLSYRQLFEPPFGRNAIQARLDALELVGRYAQRLAELSNTEAPAQFAEASSTLGQRLGGLETRVRTLAGESDFTAVAGPIGAIVGAIGQTYLEGRTRAELRRSILAAGASVEAVLDFLERDLALTVDRMHELRTRDVLTTCATYYNNHYAAWSRAQRRDFLDELEEVIQLQEGYESANPTRMIRAMRDAHEALVRFAQDPGSASTSSQRLASAMELFAARITTFVTAFNDLRGRERAVDSEDDTSDAPTSSGGGSTRGGSANGGSASVDAGTRTDAGARGDAAGGG